MPAERRAAGKQIPKETDKAKRPPRKFRERINKGEKTGGNATELNAESGARECWKPSKEGSKEASGSV